MKTFKEFLAESKESDFQWVAGPKKLAKSKHSKITDLDNDIQKQNLDKYVKLTGHPSVGVHLHVNKSLSHPDVADIISRFHKL